jgi:acetate kinase
VLVLNCGSSSVKYRLLRLRASGDGGPTEGAPAEGAPTVEAPTVEARGLAERVGSGGSGTGGAGGRLRHQGADGSEHAEDLPLPDHAAAVKAVLAALRDDGADLDGLAAVGHRVVHGGDRFTAPTLVDDGVLDAVEDLSVLAPLHNPGNVAGIRALRAALPDVAHVAVFDTAFHATMPPRASTYAVPRSWREEHGVRRYGFHGTSHAYVSRETARRLDRPLDATNTIVLHLGNGASACAVAGGRSIDTTMGLTPLAGLVMGTRSGDVDPAVFAHLGRVAGLDVEDVDRALTRESGLLGLAGSGDVRDVVAAAQAGDEAAVLALDVYCYRIRTTVGAYAAALGRLDAVTFTAGVGEHSALVRSRSLDGLDPLGITVDPTRNGTEHEPGPVRADGRISPDGAPVAVLVVPTDEEGEIARQALAVARG